MYNKGRISRIFVHLPLKFISHLKNGMIPLELPKVIEVTYSYIKKIEKRLISEGIIISRPRDGRSNSLFLTKKGKLLKNEFIKLKEALEDADKVWEG